MEYKTTFTTAQCQLLIKMLDIDYKKQHTLSEIAKLCQTSCSSPLYRKLIMYLRQIKILTNERIVGAAILVTIDNDKLQDVIAEQNITQFWEDYFNSYRGVNI
jgi:hypothetical protein